MIECRKIAELARKAFAERLRVRSVGQGCEITLPLLDSVDDWVNCYVIEFRGQWKLTDLGETISHVDSYFGFNPKSSGKRSGILGVLMEHGGISLKDDELYTMIPAGDEEQFQDSLLMFANAVERIEAMNYMSEPKPKADFKGAVMEYLGKKEIHCEVDPTIDDPILGEIKMDLGVGPRGVFTATMYAPISSSARPICEHRLTQFRQISKMPGHPETTVIYDDASAIPDRGEFKLIEEILDIEAIPWSKMDKRVGELA
jgi:hypothetical protein